ncbi:branched-chain amino acid ABC transporter permease [soil metagenome]
METFLQALVSGLSVGSIYAMVALGLVLLYRTTKVLNFAHGDMAVLATFLAFALLNTSSLSYGLVFLLTLAAAFLIGAAVYLSLVKPAKNQSALGQLILTLGLALALNGFSALVFGTDNKAMPPLVADSIVRVAGVRVSLLALFTAGLGLALMSGLWALLNFTKLGLAMRAVAQRQDVAQTLGIPVRRVVMATWGVAAALAAAAGLLFAPTALLNPAMMLDPLAKGFVAAVLGGMNSLPGAVLGGYVLGVTELLVGRYVSLEFKASFAFLVVILVLVFRPDGLLGRAEVRRV